MIHNQRHGPSAPALPSASLGPAAFAGPRFLAGRRPPRARLSALLLLGLLLAASGCSLRSAPPDYSGGSAAGQAICSTALSTVGASYVYGGSSPSSGFDCSGLVCWAYAKNGVHLPRTAREQSRVGTAVSKTNLRPGDLVVFKISSGLHTGIYTGQGRFIHSPSRGKAVRVDRLDSKYWHNKFVAGRRHRQVY